MPNFFYLSIYTIIYLLYLLCNKKKSLEILLQYLVVLFFGIFFGTRYSVGGDFHSYECAFLKNCGSLKNYEPGFRYLINFFKFLNLNFSTYNIIYIFFFNFCLIKFIKKFSSSDNEFYIFLLSFPIFFIILATGSLRQGLALSFFLLFLSLDNKNFILKYFFFVIPVFFHKSAIFLNVVFLLSFLIYLSNKYIYFKIFLFNNAKFFLFAIIFIIYLFILIFSDFINYYIFQSGYNSIGVFPRILICIFFSIIIIFNKNKTLLGNYFYISSLLSFPLLFLSFNYSTVADRLLMYIFPLVFYGSNILLDLFRNEKDKFLSKFIIFLIFFIYLFLWENFSPNYYLWNGYENYFFSF
jgi:hypothetical protein